MRPLANLDETAAMSVAAALAGRRVPVERVGGAVGVEWSAPATRARFSRTRPDPPLKAGGYCLLPAYAGKRH